MDTLAPPAATARRNAPLSGRTAIVTGSTSGIGLGIARALAAAGADIVLNGLGSDAAMAPACSAMAAEFGVAVDFDGADLVRGDAVRGLVARAVQRRGAVDILVNNAGIQHVAPLETFPDEKWDAILALNLSAAFHATKAALPGMRARRWGRILNIASAHGIVGSPFKAAYVAAKHGVIGLTKVAALETAETAITCNAICPGYVWTPLVENQIEDQARAHGLPRDRVIRDVLLARQPNTRFATVEEIGVLAAFLCSDAAASITGAALPVDGAWTAQ